MPREPPSGRPAPIQLTRPVPSVQNALFCKEGEYWTIGYRGQAFRLKDTKGLAYLAHLLRHPTMEFHVLDVARGIARRQGEQDEHQSIHGLPRGDEDLEKAGIRITSLGDAGEMLDEQAKAAYRNRLGELREELEHAKELGKVERADEVEEEIDSLTRELSRAVGMGGRNRRAASASERARQSVTKTIKAVVDRIAQSDVALGDYFSRCIKTGTFCSYQPDPNPPIAWEFGATTSEPAQRPTANDEATPAPIVQPPGSSAVLEISQFLPGERTAFVGRETERDAIHAAIDGALKGRGSVIMLAGAPGAGKKRLATEIAQYASRNGFRYYLGRCYERADPFPHLPFVEIIESSLAQAANLDDYRRQMGDNAAELAQLAPSLRRVFPDIPEPLELPPAQKRRFLFQSLSEALGRAARIRPLLLILDDLQWADESTLALLNHLANRITQLPLVIIGIYQEGYSENSPALVRTLEELIRLGVRPLKLGGLSKDAVAEMLHGLSGRQPPKSLVSLIFEESQGNPFFVEEVYRHLTEDGKIFDADGRFRDDIKIDETDVPENVRLIIGRRLGQFDENEKQVLAGAAVIGRSFSFRLLTAICQIDVDELFAIVEKAQRMGIVVSSSEGPETPFTFAHELVRQTLLAGISAPRHQQLHSNVADAIERLYPGAVNERAGEIADHLLKAKSFAVGQRLVQYLTLAGSSALEVAAFEEARGNFQSALSHQGAVGVSERAALLASLAKADAGLEQWDAALASLREALEIYVGLGDLGTISRTFTELTDALIWAGRFEQAIETARRGLVHLEKDVTVDRVSLLAALSQACATTAKYKWAQDALREAVDLASRLSDPKIKARAVGARSIVNFHFFHLREAADDGFLSEQLGGPQSPPWQRALQLRVLFQSLAYLGRREEAARVMGELVPLAKKIGQPYAVALCDSASAWAEFGKTPDLAKLDHDLQQASKSNQRARFAFWEAFAEVQLSVLNFLRGNWARALAHAQAACRPEPGRSIEGFGVGALFRQMAYAGDRAAAFSILDDRRAQLPVSGRPQTRGSWLMLAGVIEGLVILGEQKQAAQLYPLALELIATGAVVLWPISRFTQTIAGVAAAAANQWEAAEDHFQIALTQAEAFPHRLEEAEIRRFHAMMLLDRSATGDREKARTLLSAALDSYTHIAMPRHIDMIRALQTAAS